MLGFENVKPRKYHLAFSPVRLFRISLTSFSREIDPPFCSHSQIPSFRSPVTVANSS